jgi:carboxypeptidase C (cathepsin A)
MTKIIYAMFSFSLFLLMQTNINAQQQKDSSVILAEPVEFVTEHESIFNGEKVQYKAIAGETHLKKDDVATAALWSVSYIKKGVSNASKRPVTFIFNGGPGSASVWLHMGFFGPQIVQVPSDADEDDGAAPFLMKENTDALLDITDLVFIDPIGTGYSRVVGKGKTEDYWGLNEDAASVAQFIRLWVTKHKRWMSPKFIAGESFGTTRAAGVTHALESGGQTMAINGLILISQALDYAGSTSTHDNITSYFTYLPSQAVTAWYHGKAGQGKTLESFIEEARQFAYNAYLPALYRGNLLSETEKNAIAEKLSYFIGLDKTYILQSNLRVLMPRFQKELLRAEGLNVGRLDGRYTGQESDIVAERPTLGDPASYGINAAYTAALQHYFAESLNVQMDRPYLTSNRNLSSKWSWRDAPKGRSWEPSYVNVSRKLGESMRRNSALKVMVANGYYDLITPFFDAEYTYARNGIVLDRVDMKYYEAGHMMYNRQEDFDQLNKDIRAFIADLLKK